MRVDWVTLLFLLHWQQSWLGALCFLSVYPSRPFSWARYISSLSLGIEDEPITCWTSKVEVYAAGKMSAIITVNRMKFHTDVWKDENMTWWHLLFKGQRSPAFWRNRFLAIIQFSINSGTEEEMASVHKSRSDAKLVTIYVFSWILKPSTHQLSC